MLQVAPSRLYMPPDFFAEFSILMRIRPADARGGYLFANVNPYDTVVQLGNVTTLLRTKHTLPIGVLLTSTSDGDYNITLAYTPSNEDVTRALTSFVMPPFVGEWTDIALAVRDTSVTLYVQCAEYQRHKVERSFSHVFYSFHIVGNKKCETVALR